MATESDRPSNFIRDIIDEDLKTGQESGAGAYAVST